MGQHSFSSSSHKSHSYFDRIAGVSAAAGLLARGLDAYWTWHDRRRGRASLIGLPDGMLKDIGLSRGDAELEYEKPFWRG